MFDFGKRKKERVDKEANQPTQLANKAQELAKAINLHFCSSGFAPSPSMRFNTVYLGEGGSTCPTGLTIAVNSDDSYDVRENGSPGQHENIDRETMMDMVTTWHARPRA